MAEGWQTSTEEVAAGAADPGPSLNPADMPGHSMVLAVVRAEAAAVASAAEKADPVALDKAVNLLAKCCGKAVVSGVGKSGIVGRKIAATLASTGTPAVFLHAADAAHGDLGLLQTGDIGIFISQSGETEEMLALVPHLRERGVPLLGLVGNPRSSLARTVDILLDTSVEREACPLNLAPTTSTAVALALGDGLALAAMRARGITPEDYARNHPGGRIGKRLTLRVRDLMHAGADNPVILPEATWAEVIGVLCQRSLGAVNVVDGERRLVGIITDGDVRRVVQRTPPTALSDLTAKRMMTCGPVVVAPDALAYDALRLMEERPLQISVLPVVDSDLGLCRGLLRLHDIVRSGLT